MSLCQSALLLCEHMGVRRAYSAHTFRGVWGHAPPPHKNLSAPLNETVGVCTY